MCRCIGIVTTYNTTPIATRLALHANECGIPLAGYIGRQNVVEVWVPMPNNGREATSKASVHDMMTLIKQALGENLAFGLAKKIMAMYRSVVRSNAETAATN